VAEALRGGDLLVSRIAPHLVKPVSFLYPHGLPGTAAEHLLDRYGTLTEEVLELTRTDPALARPLADGFPYLGAEVAYAVTHEGALHVADVLTRRIRLSFEASDRGASAVAAVSAIMGDLLGWDSATRIAERESYLDFARTAAQAAGDLTGELQEFQPAEPIQRASEAHS